MLKEGPTKQKNIVTFENTLTECVYDDIHGFVSLTKEEKQLINHPYFRRLHFIKQNALANFIFPGATHTRFSHSIGVLYIVEKMVQRLKSLPKCKINITPFDHQIIRLAALLHDIGHYPLSHTIEECFKQYDEFFLDKPVKVKKQLEKDDSIIEESKDSIRDDFVNRISSKDAKIKDLLGDLMSEGHYESNFHHELIAKTLISNAQSPLYNYLAGILKKTYKNFTREDLSNEETDNYLHLIGQIICGNPKFATNPILLNSEEQSDKYFILSLLVNSDLDADQMDYMLRDTRNTGIQTTIRVDFLINNMDICFQEQQNGRLQPVLCFNYKAFESVQQFIFSKAYWYTEIILYDKVAILNKIAQRIYLYYLIKNYKITSIEDFYEQILFNSKEYIKFTDQDYWNKIQEMYEDPDTPEIILKMIKILIGEINIPKPITFDKLSLLPNKNFMTSFVPVEKSNDEKLKIYDMINKKFLGNCFPIFYSNKFFKKSSGENIQTYANRSIHILISPCKDFEKCEKKCNKVEEILKSEQLGQNLLHKIMLNHSETIGQNTLQRSFIEKCVVYDFIEF